MLCRSDKHIHGQVNKYYAYNTFIAWVDNKDEERRERNSARNLSFQHLDSNRVVRFLANVFPVSLSPILTQISEKSVQTSDSCKFSHHCCNPRNSRVTSENKSFQYLSNYYSKRIIYPIISIVSRRCVYRRSRRRFSKCFEAFYTRFFPSFSHPSAVAASISRSLYTPLFADRADICPALRTYCILRSFHDEPLPSESARHVLKRS